MIISQLRGVVRPDTKQRKNRLESRSGAVCVCVCVYVCVCVCIEGEMRKRNCIGGGGWEIEGCKSSGKEFV